MLAATHTGRGLLQAPVAPALAGDVARDSLTRLSEAQNLAAAKAAAVASPATAALTPQVPSKSFPIITTCFGGKHLIMSRLHTNILEDIPHPGV